MNEMEPSNGRAYVPEFLQKRTVKTMPIDTPYFIWSDDIDDEDNPCFWVNSRSQLCVRASAEVYGDDDMPYWDELPGRIGLMKTPVRNESGGLRVGYVADLRFIEPHSLKVDDYDASMPSDPEEFNEWTEWQQQMIEIDGFLYEDEEGKVYYSGAPVYESAARYVMKVADRRPESPRSHLQPEKRPPRLVDSAKTSIQALRTRMASHRR